MATPWSLGFLAIAVRFVLFAGEPLLLTGDSWDYLEIAHSLTRGELSPRLASVRMPGYPLLLAGWILATGGAEQGLLLLQVSMGVTSSLLAYSIGQTLAGRAGALLLGAGVAMHPVFLISERLVMTETSSLLFSLLALRLALSTARAPGPGGLRLGAGFGLAAGFAILIRLDNLFPLGALGATLPFAMGADTRGERRTFGWPLLRRVATIAAGPVLCLGIWVTFLYAMNGELQLIGNVQRNRVVALALHGVLDPNLGTMTDYRADFRPEDGGTVYQMIWRLEERADRESVARTIFEQQSHALRWQIYRLRVHALLSYLGLAPQDVEPTGCRMVRFWVREWLPAFPTPHDIESRRATIQSGLLKPGSQNPIPWVTKLLASVSGVFLGWIRPALVATSLAALFWLLMRARRRAQRRELILIVGLFAGHIFGALAHAWYLMDEDRYGIAFDWIPLTFLLAAIGFRNRQGFCSADHDQVRPDSKVSEKIGEGEPSSSAPTSRTP